MIKIEGRMYYKWLQCTFTYESTIFNQDIFFKLKWFCIVVFPVISHHEKMLCSSCKHRGIEPNKATLSRGQRNVFLQFIFFNFCGENIFVSQNIT